MCSTGSCVPNIDNVIPDAGTATTRLVLNDNDTEYLLGVVPRSSSKADPTVQFVAGQDVQFNGSNAADRNKSKGSGVNGTVVVLS